MDDFNFYRGRCIRYWDYLNITYPCAICGQTKNTGYNGPYFGIIIKKGELDNKSNTAEWRHICCMEHGKQLIDKMLDGLGDQSTV